MATLAGHGDTCTLPYAVSGLCSIFFPCLFSFRYPPVSYVDLGSSVACALACEAQGCGSDPCRGRYQRCGAKDCIRAPSCTSDVTSWAPCIEISADVEGPSGAIVVIVHTTCHDAFYCACAVRAPPSARCTAWANFKRLW